MRQPAGASTPTATAYLNGEDGVLYAFDRDGNVRREDLPRHRPRRGLHAGLDRTGRHRIYTQNNGVLFAIGATRARPAARRRRRRPTGARRGRRPLGSRRASRKRGRARALPPGPDSARLRRSVRRFRFPDAQVAQLVEQGTENPCVGGSIPSLGTIFPRRRSHDDPQSREARRQDAARRSRGTSTRRRSRAATTSRFCRISKTRCASTTGRASPRRRSSRRCASSSTRSIPRRASARSPRCR